MERVTSLLFSRSAAPIVAMLVVASAAGTGGLAAANIGRAFRGWQASTRVLIAISPDDPATQSQVFGILSRQGAEARRLSDQETARMLEAVTDDMPNGLPAPALIEARLAGAGRREALRQLQKLDAARVASDRLAGEAFPRQMFASLILLALAVASGARAGWLEALRRRELLWLLRRMGASPLRTLARLIGSIGAVAIGGVALGTIAAVLALEPQDGMACAWPVGVSALMVVTAIVAGGFAGLHASIERQA